MSEEYNEDEMKAYQHDKPIESKGVGVKMYITFGQAHVHSVNGHTLDHNCVAVIKGCNREACDAMAFEWMDGKFHQHTLLKPDMEFFPRGLIEIN